MNKERLKRAGIDYDAGVKRFLGDADLYEEMLAEFVGDHSFEEMCEDYEAKDYASLFHKAHTLKGLSGNLDMTELYAAACDMTECLRSGQEEQVPAQFERVRAAYSRVIDGIKE